MTWVTRIAVSLLPLALTPAIIWLLAEGYVSLGGGEKDLIIALPWLVWSIFFAAAFLIGSRRGLPISKAGLRALGWATGLIVLLWILLWILMSDWLGV